MQIKTTRYHLTVVRMTNIKKSTNNKCCRGCGDKGTLLHCWLECKLVQPLWRTVWSFLKKLKIQLPYNPAVPLMGIYPEKTLIWNDTCTPAFVVTLYTTNNIWKKPKCSWTDEWIEKMWNGIYSGILLSHRKEMLFAATWMDLEIITLSEVNQMKINIKWYCLYSESLKNVENEHELIYKIQTDS